MRFMILVKGNEETESGVIPDKKLFADMTKFNNELKNAKVLITLDGLKPSSSGIRILFSNDKPVIVDGPFPNPKELVAGYWIINVKSKDEAIKWAKRIPFKDGVVEIRQIQDVSDFPEDIQKVVTKFDFLKIKK